MALGGDLSKIDLTAIFQTLALNQQVGTLVVTEKESGRKTSLYFDQNTVALVASDKRNYFRLGQILVNRGIISDEVLRRALEQQKRAGGLLGEVLCELGVVTPDAINDVVRSQIEEEIFELFQWRQARFEFLEGAPPSKSALDGYITSINFDPNSLLMEAARRLDEWDVMKEFIPSLQEILIIDEEAWDDEEFEELSVADRQIIDLLDGERDIQDIAQDTSLPRFQICKTLYDWLRDGKIRSLTAIELEALADDCEQTNNIPLAIKFYLRSFASNDQSEHMSERLAHCHETIGEARKAAEFFTHLADLQWNSGKVAAAVEAYRKAVKLNPGQTVALERLFEHAANENDVGSVLNTGKALLKSYMKELQVAEAADLCRGLLERFPEDLDLRKQMINIHLDRRDAKAAAKEYEEILELLKKEKAWGDMADVCSKIVQLDPERDEYRPLIETYRARSERSFKKLIRKPVVILPMASLVVLMLLLVIGYNVMAGRGYDKAREASVGGLEEEALKKFLEVARNYPWSLVRQRAEVAAAEIGDKIDERKKQIQSLNDRIMSSLEAGREAWDARALKLAEEELRQVADERLNPDRRKPQVMRGIEPRLDEADALLAQIKTKRKELEGRLAEAQTLVGERRLDAAVKVLDEISEYGLWDKLANDVLAVRNDIRRITAEQAAIDLHELYVEAREAETEGDLARATTLYRRCLVLDVYNLEYADARRFLSLQKELSSEVVDSLQRIERSRERKDWQGMNQKILNLIQNFPELADDPKIRKQVRFRIFVRDAPSRAKLSVRHGDTILVEHVVDADGRVVLDLPPRPARSMTIVVDAPGFSAVPHLISSKIINSASAALRVERLPAWVAPANARGAIEGGVTIDGQDVYVPSRDGKLYVFDLSTGGLRTTYDGKRQELVAPATVLAGVAYLGKLNGKQFVGVSGAYEAFDEGAAGDDYDKQQVELALEATEAGRRAHIDQMRERWFAAQVADEKFALPIKGFVKGQAAQAGGVIVFGTSQSKIRAIDPNGAALWEKEVSAGVEADVVTDGVNFYAATRAGVVYSFAPGGDLNWQRNLGHAVVARMAIDGERLYVGSIGGTMMAFKLRDGEDAWASTLTLRDVEVRGGCAIAGQFVIAGAERNGSGVILVVKAATGELVQDPRIAREPVRSRPAVRGDRVYLGTTFLKNGAPVGGSLFALLLTDGKLVTRWHWQSNKHPVEGAIGLGIGHLGETYVIAGSLTGFVHAFRD